MGGQPAIPPQASEVSTPPTTVLPTIDLREERGTTFVAGMIFLIASVVQARPHSCASVCLSTRIYAGSEVWARAVFMPTCRSVSVSRLEWPVRSGVSHRGFQFDPERFGDARQVFPIMIPVPLAGSARPASKFQRRHRTFLLQQQRIFPRRSNHCDARSAPLGGAKQIGREWWRDARRVS